MSCNRASPALIPQLSSYLIIRPFFSLENVYTVCPRKRIRGAQGSFSLPSISHSATICDCASLRSRENNLVLGLSTRASITGRKLARLRSNVWTPMIALSYCKCSNIDILQYTSFPLPQFKKEIVAFVASTLERERWVGEQAVPIVHARCEFSRPEIISFLIHDSGELLGRTSYSELTLKSAVSTSRNSDGSMEGKLRSSSTISLIPPAPIKFVKSVKPYSKKINKIQDLY